MRFYLCLIDEPVGMHRTKIEKYTSAQLTKRAKTTRAIHLITMQMQLIRSINTLPAFFPGTSRSKKQQPLQELENSTWNEEDSIKCLRKRVTGQINRSFYEIRRF